MAAVEVFRSLSTHWADTVGYLRAEDLRLVDETARLTAAAAAGTGDTRDARTAMLRLSTVLYDRLPAGHPVAIVFSSGAMLSGPAPFASQLPVIAVALDAVAALSPVAPSPVAVPDDSDDSDEAADWLLAAPALTGQQVRDGGADPSEPGLIRLAAPDGRERIPAFQFSPAGAPIAVVLRINRLLDAEDDPFGVADWWLGRNAWLDAVPAELIGQVDDELLVRAARAELGVG
jgi:hypothetical protein